MDITTEVIGFTGSRDVTPQMLSALATYVGYLAQRRREDKDGTLVIRAVHGGCVGVDDEVSKLLMSAGIYQTVIFPSDMSQAARSCRYRANEVVEMPEGSTYRQRDEEVVLRSTKLIAVPRYPEKHPKSRRSGTWMTVRIARKHHVPVEVLGPFE